MQKKACNYSISNRALGHQLRLDIGLYYNQTRAQRRKGVLKDWFDITREILISGSREPCSVEIILDWALSLLHHNVHHELRDSNWIGSSSKGQVVFPRLFELSGLSEDGYLGLYCFPGTLMVESTRNKNVALITAKRSGRKVRSDREFLSSPVTQAINLYSSDKLLWHTDTLVDSLNVAIGWSGNIDRLNPFHVFGVLRKAAFLRSCS